MKKNRYPAESVLTKHCQNLKFGGNPNFPIDMFLTAGHKEEVPSNDLKNRLLKGAYGASIVGAITLVPQIDDSHLDAAVNFIKAQGWVAALPGLGAFLRHTAISPERAFRAFHKAGVEGAEVLVAVIDIGFQATDVLMQKRSDQVLLSPDPDDEEMAEALFETHKKAEHGTKTSDIIARGAPEADLVLVEKNKKHLKKLIEHDFIEAGLKEPERVSLESFRAEFIKPLIDSLANQVVTAVDRGADVINVSLGFEQALISIFKKATLKTKYVDKYRDSDSFAGSLAKKIIEKEKGFADKNKTETFLRNLKRSINQYTNPEDKEQILHFIAKDYKKWTHALDYAEQKGAMVVLSAGNKGGHTSLDNDIAGLGNMCSFQSHPALVTVGATNGLGRISHFSSEFGEDVNPDLAANGESLIFRTKRPPLLNYQRFTKNWPLNLIFLPLYLTKNIRLNWRDRFSKGTSFSAPEITTTIALIQSQSIAKNGKKFSLNKIRNLLTESTDPVHFDKKHLTNEILPEALNRLVEKRIINPDELQNDEELPRRTIELVVAEISGEVRRRVGVGEINTTKALWLAENQLQTQGLN